MVNWANLPYNLLHVVLDKLFEHKEHAIFSSICRNWQSVCEQHRHKLPPMLMIPTQSCNPEIRDLYSISENKCLYKLRVPRNRGCYGLPYGWIACLNRRMSITLINPFTTAKQIRTPPLKFPPEICPQLNIHKVILTADPKHDFAIVVIYSRFNTLAYYKPGMNMKTWTYLDRKLKSFSEIIVHRGLVFASTNFSKLIAFDVNRNTHDRILGTDAVFMSSRNAFCVPVKEYNGCQPNSICFSSDNLLCNWEVPHMRINIFNLENQEWRKLYQRNFTERLSECHSWVELPLP